MCSILAAAAAAARTYAKRCAAHRPASSVRRWRGAWSGTSLCLSLYPLAQPMHDSLGPSEAHRMVAVQIFPALTIIVGCPSVHIGKHSASLRLAPYTSDARA